MRKIIDHPDSYYNDMVKNTVTILKECSVCRDAKTLGGNFVCPLHWVMPSSEYIDEDGNKLS